MLVSLARLVNTSSCREAKKWVGRPVGFVYFNNPWSQTHFPGREIILRAALHHP